MCIRDRSGAPNYYRIFTNSGHDDKIARISEKMEHLIEELSNSKDGTLLNFMNRALWLNGSYVGYTEDSFSAHAFDLTPYLQPGVNKLAVQVFKWTSSSWCEDQDFFRFSGIFRSVWLYAIPTVHLEDVYKRQSRYILYTLPLFKIFFPGSKRFV